MLSALSRVPASNLYYGWYIVAALSATQIVGWGVLYYAFAVFIHPMEVDLGWSRAEMTGAFSVALLAKALSGFPAAWWMDRYGVRSLMTMGSTIGAGLVFAWSYVDSIVGFYAIFAGIGICSTMVLYEPAFATVTRWFNAKRGEALAFITFAGGLASTVFVPLTNILNSELGWRGALQALAIILAVTTIPLHGLVLRQRQLPEEHQKKPPDDKPSGPPSIGVGVALRRRVFWLITALYSISFLSSAAIRVHLIPFLINNDVSANVAAGAVGGIGLMQVGGRLVIGPLGDRLSGRVLLGGIFGLQAAAMVLLLFVGPATWAIFAFVGAFGAAVGARTLIRPTIIADVFGLLHFARISSVMTLIVTVMSTLAPVGAGILFDNFGSYGPVMVVLTVLALLAAMLAIVVGPQITTPSHRDPNDS